MSIANQNGTSEHHHDHSNIHESKTRIVVILTTLTMVVEIFFGYWTNSMALLADGFHMSSHAFALGLSWLAYVLARKYAKTETFSFKKKSCWLFPALRVL